MKYRRNYISQIVYAALRQRRRYPAMQFGLLPVCLRRPASCSDLKIPAAPDTIFPSRHSPWLKRKACSFPASAKVKPISLLQADFDNIFPFRCNDPFPGAAPHYAPEVQKLWNDHCPWYSSQEHEHNLL